ncbi:MFS transporter [Azospirillum palustre]
MQRKTGRFLATFLPSILLIVAALVFSAGINLGTFRRDCGDALFSTFGVAGRKVVTSIEYAVKYGKTIENFFGMERALSQLKTYLPQADGVAVALPDGQVAYAIGTYGFKDRIGDRLTGYEQRRTAGEFQRATSFNYHDTDSRSHKLFLPIRDPADGRWIGTLVIAAGDSVIDDYVRAFERHTLILVGALGGVAILLLGGLALLPDRGRGGLGRPRSGRAALAVAALVQIAVGVTGYGAFSDAYLRTVENTTGIVENIVATDIGSVIGRGATYRSFSGIDDYFREIIGIVPHFKGMSLAVPEGADLPGSLGSGQPAAKGDLVTGRALATDADFVTPSLRIVIDSDFIQRNMLEVVANNVTILIISLMFIYELHAFVSRRMRPTVETVAGTVTDAADAAAATGRSLAGLRFLTFMLYFGMFLSASFVPVIMQTFDRGLFGLAPPQAAAIPVSVEMLCGALAILLAGRISARLPWRTMTAAGLAVAVLGALVSGVTGDPVLFIVARGLVGAGTMTALMGLYRLIDRIRRIDPATGAYSDLFSGMYVGVNCGAVVGSLLADAIGPHAVFLIAAVVLTLGIGQLLLLTPEPAGAAAIAAAAPTIATPDGEAAAARRVWSDGSFLAFLLLVSVPTSACSMFLIYYFPLFASGLGQPASTVGQAFLLYGLCIVYLGPLLSRLMRSSNMAPGLPVLASGLIMAAGLTTFALTGSLVGAFLAILLLGLSDSFGLTAQQRYLERLPVVGTHGLAVPQSYHLNARKIGQVIGPMLFSAAAVAGGAGATLIGLGLAAALLLHLGLSVLALRRRPFMAKTA